MSTTRLLFVCTHNSARSILAEALTNRLGRDRLRAYSAGSHPSGQVNPLALTVSREHGCRIDNLRSKSWNVFAEPGVEALDAVVTVCDDAASEACPVWPGMPARTHWGLPDPSRAPGDDAARLVAFRSTAENLILRLRRVLELPLDRLDPPQLRHELQRIHDEAVRPAR